MRVLASGLYIDLQYALDLSILAFEAHLLQIGTYTIVLVSKVQLVWQVRALCVDNQIDELTSVVNERSSCRRASAR